jgi:hypothetical protein
MRDMVESGNPFLVAIAAKGVDHSVSVAQLACRFTAHQHSALDWLFFHLRSRRLWQAGAGDRSPRRLAKTKISLLTQADRYCQRRHYLKTRSAGPDGGPRRASLRPSRRSPTSGQRPPFPARGTYSGSS